MDIGIAEVRKSEKALGGGGREQHLGAELSIGGGGEGARAPPKVYKLTPVSITFYRSELLLGIDLSIIHIGFV